MKYIASCSFGKDSLATVLLAIKHKEPLDRVVFVETMFDIKRNISGEIPEHIQWVYNHAIPKLESLGVEVDVIRGEDDYMSVFFKKKTKNVKDKNRVGKFQGFVGGLLNCKMQYPGKIKPINQYKKNFHEKITFYVGIAIDEPKRIAKLKDGCISLLAKYNYTEDMARELCEEYDLISPAYKDSAREGCWFCQNQSVACFVKLRQRHPNLWQELKKLDAVENKVSDKFRYAMTLSELEIQMDKYEKKHSFNLVYRTKK